MQDNLDALKGGVAADAPTKTMAENTADIATNTADIATNTISINELRQSATKTGDYIITDSDELHTIYVTTAAATITITLPTAADNTDRELLIIKEDSGAGKITIDGEGAETIQGEATLDVGIQYAGIKIKCDGTEWFIIDSVNCGPVDISGTVKLVYTKYFAGTLDADAATNVAHGVTFGQIVRFYFVFLGDKAIVTGKLF